MVRKLCKVSVQLGFVDRTRGVTESVAKLSYHKLSACQARFIFNGGFISPDFEPGSGLHDFDR
jgi:hypothetical protein